MSFTSKAANEILVAGLQDQMFTVDVNKGEITKTVCILLYKADRSADILRFPHKIIILL
jgi:hypothetical protein